MNDQRMEQLLAQAVRESERRAPLVDPVAALDRARRRAERRRGHLVALSFVVFALALQALPSEAFGSSERPAVLAVWHSDPFVRALVAGPRPALAGGRG